MSSSPSSLISSLNGFCSSFATTPLVWKSTCWFGGGGGGVELDRERPVRFGGDVELLEHALAEMRRVLDQGGDVDGVGSRSGSRIRAVHRGAQLIELRLLRFPRLLGVEVVARAF